MKCSTVKTPGGFSIVCSSGSRKTCACGKPATKLCDWPKNGGGTCDKPLCADCARNGGPDIDYCKSHGIQP